MMLQYFMRSHISLNGICWRTMDETLLLIDNILSVSGRSENCSLSCSNVFLDSLSSIFPLKGMQCLHVCNVIKVGKGCLC